MIIDVESDIDEHRPACRRPQRRQRDLAPGRNFVPLTAYKNSSVSFDFEGNHVPAASIQPPRTRYHLNKGGVDYRKITVSKTLTVLGRLLDPQGKPLKGHHVINHASRGVTRSGRLLLHGNERRFADAGSASRRSVAVPVPP